MAGFEVIIYGRFWVIAEGLRKQTARLRERTGINHIKPHTWRHQLCTEMLETRRSRGDSKGRDGVVLKANDRNLFA